MKLSFCFGCFKAICITALVGSIFQSDVQGQRPNNSRGWSGPQQEGEPVVGRPDIRAISPASVLPKLRERRRFDNQGMEEYRTFNGMFNNLARPREGSIFTELIRIAPAAYGPHNSLARQHLPSARVISNEVVNQNISKPNDRNMTDLVWQWGQFMDHDLDLTEAHAPQQFANIPVMIGDPVFDPGSIGNITLPFSRSLFRVHPLRVDLERQQLNEITAWIDASMVYGSDQATADNLRTFQDGLMATTGGGLFLPLNGDQSEFLAGDKRVTEQAGLATMHTLLVREHNRIATEIKSGNPGLSDETIYQRARKKVYGIVQAITYNEWLPALLGEDHPLDPYNGYDPSVSPNIANEFSTAAFRIGHTLLNNQLLRLNDDGTPIADGAILLRDAFFNVPALLDYGIEPYLKGQMTQIAQELDAEIIGAVRNFLFGNVMGFGMDLAALNIQRARDHGLPDFNTIRIAYGLPALNSFAELTSNPLLQAKLASVYPSVNDIDPWIGFVAEDHAPGSSCGPTLIAAMKDQYERCRDADRFWYELVFSGAELDEIHNTTLADVIRRNTTLTNVQDNVFFNSN